MSEEQQPGGPTHPAQQADPLRRVLEGVAVRLDAEQPALLVRLVPVLSLINAGPQLAVQPLLGEPTGLDPRLYPPCQESDTKTNLLAALPEW